jgi:hypothetical protein
MYFRSTFAPVNDMTKASGGMTDPLPELRRQLQIMGHALSAGPCRATPREPLRWLHSFIAGGLDDAPAMLGVFGSMTARLWPFRSAHETRITRDIRR